VNTVDIIRKKRDGKSLTKDELNYLMQGYVKGYIPDYQMAAFAMAVYFKGMSDEEIANLTTAIVESGSLINMSSTDGVKVDKHSTGGVGDKTTLIVAPLVASFGVKVAKLSGRGLGHTGGTIDKLEAIPGFCTNFSIEDFILRVKNANIAIMAQTSDITPADKKLYALRDVTATVDSIPLIASSIMSKKIALGVENIVLDVKVGLGGLVKDIASGIELANTMLNIGKKLGKKVIVVISNMEQPLGYSIGNSLEVEEAIEVLKGRGSGDLLELSLTISSYMLCLANRFKDLNTARESALENIASGKAYAVFENFIKSQGGDLKRLPKAKNVVAVPSIKEGYINKIDAKALGLCAVEMGAGRFTKEDSIDYSVGIVLKKKVGDMVNKGDTLAYLHLNSKEKIEYFQKKIRASINVSNEKVKPFEIIYKVIK